MDAHEIQALLRHHCSAIVETIDDGGIKPSQIGTLQATAKRIAELTNDLEGCALEDDKPTVTGPKKRFKL